MSAGLSSCFMYDGADRTGFARELRQTLGVEDLSDVYAGELSGRETRQIAAVLLIPHEENVAADSDRVFIMEKGTLSPGS